MPFFKVTYQSMTAFYSSIIEASDEYQARILFKGSAFSENEMSLIRAKQLSLQELKRELQRKDED